jgi:magnesium transporter
MLREDAVTWIDVQGLGDETLLKRIGAMFSLHELTTADIVNLPQRPKAELYDDQLFVVLRMARSEHNDHFATEQISIVVGRNYLLTFQERYGDVLDPLRRRLRSGKGPIRREGADYLAYAVIDAIIDGYFPALESIGERLLWFEQQAFDHPTKSTMKGISQIRNELLEMRRLLWPLREALNSLIRDENELVSDTVRVYLRDCLDHCLQVSEVTESYVEITAAATNIYLSSVSNRLNEVMKVLTVMASIFIPLTFLVGIYGMNFEHMPELHYRYAYLIVWIVMVGVAAVMWIYFRRKGWIGSGDDDRQTGQ